MFSKLACVCKDKVATETIEEWTKIATLGADFLKKHGSGEDGFYFALKQDGSPLVQPYNIFRYVVFSDVRIINRLLQ